MSALPSKYIPVEYSVVGVAAFLLAALRHNDTVSMLWDRVKHDARVRTFDRFANALTILFAGRVIMMEKGVLRVDAGSEPSL
ncbi:hypothetical protein BSY18_4154 (plasmid) [Blastomonas sp. RAC04]|uniref:ABC-three component system middle component 6 n=1 Tax=Blastomonas sp. RAC04 TaxID=1842535 RepID=UPI00083CF81A|nr:ABC-three component system middle component 6 [Blastomonas sp. RAC04]AOG02554.1 hypothetical protein BSY18_4154 [Blastomonas sp. RAC04]